MGWRLAHGTGYCEAGGELVFLDLARDKYLSLRGRDRAAFERLRAGEPNDSDAMTRLVATGLFARCDGGHDVAPTRVLVPFRDLASHHDAPFGVGMAIQAARALGWAKRAMRSAQIASTVERLRTAKRELAVPGDEDAIVAIARRYSACRWLIPIEPRCLVDALALDRILLKRRLAVSLVFGVRLDPFAAHCWLQTPETILTGTLAEARNYTPILVVA
ncbi:lasso peptide biosynthesis B2 protein [Sphingopyxis sp. DHUNG17]|uniref:lasso peptide biosynthesis B2 protein n=1 Tax=Sphingopyxis jiangsuensis TaxID=2871171 RepID=UPI00191CB327|nr:lasso peptide biosynthesis B2 protein [Sphingopyxis lutea]MBL0770019.1 lasso peptide biosynthesis B2 protein [Sphingopyxis lutea]